MKFKTLVKELCAREGLKKKMDIAQVTEIVGHLCDILSEADFVKFQNLMIELLAVGGKRAKKKKKLK